MTKCFITFLRYYSSHTRVLQICWFCGFIVTYLVPSSLFASVVRKGVCVLFKCENCQQQPTGDFYQLKSSILCSRCFEYNYKWQEKYSRAYLSTFKKARDCSFMHEHDGTTAVVQVNFTASFFTQIEKVLNEISLFFNN